MIRWAALKLAVVAVVAGHLSAQGSERVVVLVDMGMPVGAETLKVIEQAVDRLPARVEVIQGASAERSDRIPGTVVLFGVDELRLQRLARRGELVPLRSFSGGDDVSDLPPSFLGPEGRYAITLLSPFTLAFDEREWTRETAPQSWDDLLFQSEYRQQLGICPPAVEPTPWVAWMQLQLGRGANEEKAYAWLTTMDAVVGRYGESVTEPMLDLNEGTVSLAIVPLRLLQSPGPWNVDNVDFRHPDEGLPVKCLGVAVMRGRGASASGGQAGQVYERLVRRDFTDLVAATLSLVPAPRLGGQAMSAEQRALTARFLREVPDADRADTWMRHFRDNLRGHGRELDQLDSILDLVFAGMFIAFVVFVYFRIRRSEARRDAA